MGNQASEDAETARQILLDYAFETATANERGDGKRWDSAVDQALKELEALIRTEKLKLLDEVIHQSSVNLKSAKAVAGWAELRKKQLETEL